MKTLKITLGVMLVLSVSCATIKKLEFYGETVRVKYPKQQRMLTGKPVLLEGEYTGFMKAYDGMLVFESDQHSDGWLYIYNTETGKRTHAIGKKGEGPDEFVNLFFPGNFEKDSSGIALWVSDFSKNTVALLNLQNERIKEINTSKFKSTNWYGVGSFHILNDSLLLAHVAPIKIFEYRYTPVSDYVFNYKRGEVVEKHISYSEYDETAANGFFPGDYLSSISAMKPDKTKHARVMYHLKRVDILNLKSGKIKSIATQDAPDLNYFSSGEPVKMHYQALSCDDHYIYVLEYAEGGNSGTVNVFDWDGNFVHVLRINESGELGFALDPIRKILYTKTAAEEVTAYDVKFLYK